MSENARRVPRELPITATVASNLSEWANTFLGDVDGIPVPLSPQYVEGNHYLTALEARALNWAYVNRATSVANSELTRTGKAKGSDAEKAAWLKAYLNGGYQFTERLGGVFSASILEIAADKLFFEIGRTQGKFSGEYKGPNTNAVAREARAEMVTKILTDPTLSEKYTPLVSGMIARLLTEKVETQERTKKDKVDATAVEL